MRREDFPKDFRWGAATAAFQIEGASDQDGRGPCIWDTFCAIPGKVRDGDTGKTACDHYHRYQEDVNLMAELGINAYRFSLSWSRLLPTGSTSGAGALNDKGVAFYDHLVDALLEKGIEPSATLYHWDLPQALQDKGGWVNRDTVYRFRDYAELAFKLYGDRVKRWYTHNEPWVAAFAGHLQGRHAPGIADLSSAVAVSHHLHISHALAVEAFRKSAVGDGQIGMVLNLYPVVAASDSAEDAAAAELCDAYQNRWFLDPLYRGTYPAELRARFEAAGAPVPEAAGDAGLLKAQKTDFLGVNYYFRKVVRAASTETLAKGAIPHPTLPFEEIIPEGAWRTEMGWEVYAPGLTELLTRVAADYGNPAMVITENGAAFKDDAAKGSDYAVEDEDRRVFLESHLVEALRCIRQGVRLEGYYEWSLMDNFEWAHGYHKRFGLFRVDYNTLKRSWKKSGRWYQSFLAGR